MNLKKNEVALGKSNSCKNTHLAKHTFVETHTCKGSKKKKTNGETLKPSTSFLLCKKKNNKHTMLYLYGTKDLT